MRLILLALILVGFGLRLHRLDVSPFRGDEAFTAQYWAALPLDQSLTQIATIEPHPALTYISYHLWGRLVGTDEFTLRMFPALVSLLAIPAVYGVGRRLGGGGAGLLAAGLWLLHSFELWHAQDARNYALWAAFSAVGLWLGLVALQRNRPADWVRYGLAVTLAANFFYNEWFTLIGFGLYTLLTYRGDGQRLRRWGLAAGVAVATSGLSFAVLQLPLLGRGGYAGTASGFDPALLPGLLTTLIFGRSLPPEWIMPAFAGVMVCIGLLLLSAGRGRGWLLCIGLVPIVLLSIASLRLRIFAPQYVLAAVPGLIVPLALMVTGKGWRRLPLRAFSGLFLVGYVGLSLLSLNNYFYDPAYRKAANWPPVTNYLAGQAAPDDLVIQQSIDAAFGYYYWGVAEDIALPASPAQPVNAVDSALERYARQNPAIWLVGQPYPEWPNGNAVQSWLDARWQPVFNQWADGLRVQQYRSWVADERELTGLPAVGTLPGLVEVRAARLLPPILPGGEVTLWLYWQPTGQSAEPLRVFVHLIGATNPATGTPLWAQDDGPPQDGRLSTDSWAVGALYRDVYQVPLAGVPPGTYELRIGFYDPVSGQRVLTGDGDSLLAGVIPVPS
jgi:hypothetical protein